ncbi:30S ribosomal protein S17 [Calditerricola satsumensis]|uniref:Small ribosomal subunit protein uS17 n=1 Tax=Calditerricola satsumensis TaxID=373054 RepID=A0A8J3BGD0_9BACI|nr:30S ribosomal protein S17 [Calditerricola satsumensis]
MAQQERGKRKVLVGKVVSDKMDKSIVVLVETYKRHPLYKKRVLRSKKYMAHDEHNEARIGDVVKIMETRPLSKRKRWRLVEILERASAEDRAALVEEQPEPADEALAQVE